MRPRVRILLVLFVLVVIVDLLFVLSTLRGCAREATPKKTSGFDRRAVLVPCA